MSDNDDTYQEETSLPQVDATEPMSEHALRPCPFCGKPPFTPTMEEGQEHPECRCFRCGIEIMYAPQWNTRPLEQELLAACKLARKEIAPRFGYLSDLVTYLDGVISRAEATEGSPPPRP